MKLIDEFFRICENIEDLWKIHRVLLRLLHPSEWHLIRQVRCLFFNQIFCCCFDFLHSFRFKYIIIFKVPSMSSSGGFHRAFDAETAALRALKNRRTSLPVNTHTEAPSVSHLNEISKFSMKSLIYPFVVWFWNRLGYLRFLLNNYLNFLNLSLKEYGLFPRPAISWNENPLLPHYFVVLNSWGF